MIVYLVEAYIKYKIINFINLIDIFTGNYRYVN